MPRQIIVLSGRVSSGKSSLASQLAARVGAHVLHTKKLILNNELTRRERGALQREGERLDKKTGGKWVAEAIGRVEGTLPDDAAIVVDAVRIKNQIDHIRKAFGPSVTHVHLKANLQELAGRYSAKRGTGVKEFSSYRSVMADNTESKVDTLERVADVVIDTAKCTKEDVFVRAASHLGFYAKATPPLVDVIVGGQYGSEGKGHIASYLAKEYEVLLRVGGPNAGHTVFESPKSHKLHQLPSGTPRCDAKLIIGPGAVIEPNLLRKEIADFGVSALRLSIDPQVMVIESRDMIAERNLVKKIGSTGQGVGAATSRRIMGRSSGSTKLARHIRELKPYIRETCAELERAFRAGRKVLVEGTQGTGLSLYHGAYPHVTSRDTTVMGCLAEAGIPPKSVRRVVMVCRTYPIRVEDPKRFTSGPMAQEIAWKEVSQRSGVPLEEILGTERTTTTNRKRRVAEFDWALLRRAATLNGPTDIALTFADYLTIRNREARRFEQLDDATLRFIHEVERVASAPVSLISTRFEYRSIIDRRAW